MPFGLASTQRWRDGTRGADKNHDVPFSEGLNVQFWWENENLGFFRIFRVRMSIVWTSSYLILHFEC
jgi:hypothetical protein